MRASPKKVTMVFPDGNAQDFMVNKFPMKDDEFTMGPAPFIVTKVTLRLSPKGTFDSAIVWCDSVGKESDGTPNV